MKIYYLILLMCSTLLLCACAPDVSSDHYVANNVGTAQRVQYGKIIKAKPVVIASHNAGTGSMVGTAAGATVGSALGDTTRMNILGALGGALIGGIAGHEIGKRAGNQTGIQYIVQLENGRVVSLVQSARPLLAVGQRVMLLTGGRATDRLIAA